MSSEWINTSLAEFAEINPKRPIAKGTVASFVDMAALPTHSRDITLADVVRRPFTSGGAKFANGDTLVARITPCLENGKTALASGLPADCNSHGSTEFIVLGPRSHDDRNFLYYLARSDDFRSYAISRMEGTSGRQRVPNSAVGEFAFLCPPKLVRKDIGNFLCAVDDRITLLRETNATLEAIAQALFKSWFVDFDPVRAKMEGRTPEGMDEATAALFPDGFEESALGLLPRGWEIVTVADVSAVVKGKSYSSKDLVAEHDTALVTLKSFERGGGFRLDGFKPYSGTYKTTQVVVPGDLIIAYTDVTQAAELIGKPAIVVGVSEHKTLVASLDVGIVRPFESKTNRQFLYGIFKTDGFQAHTFAHTSGTTVLHLSKDGVGSYKFACPPFELVNSFSVVAEALASRRQVNIDQIRNLATLRDTLLPRLISGQLRLPAAAAMLDNA